MNELLLRGGRPWTPGAAVEVADILVRDGRIAEIGPGLTADTAETVDLAGALVLPGLVDAHCHLDKTMFGGPWVPNTGGRTLAGRIANGEGRREELGLPSADYASNLLAAMVSGGPRTYAVTSTSTRRWGCAAWRRCGPRPPGTRTGWTCNWWPSRRAAC